MFKMMSYFSVILYFFLDQINGTIRHLIRILLCIDFDRKECFVQKKSNLIDNHN